MNKLSKKLLATESGHHHCLACKKTFTTPITKSFEAQWIAHCKSGSHSKNLEKYLSVCTYINNIYLCIISFKFIYLFVFL